MSSAIPTKDDRINLRLKQSTKRILERAASFAGQPVSKFVLNSALARAEQTIHEHEVVSLTARDADVFFNAIAAPIRFNKKLLAALAEHEQRVASE